MIGQRVQSGVVRSVVALLLCAAPVLLLTGSGVERRAREAQARAYATAELDTTPTLDQVLERYIEAVGGRDALERLTTRVSTGWMITDLPSRQSPVLEVSALETYTKVPDRCLVVERTADGVRREGFDGRIGWVEDADSVWRHDYLSSSATAWLSNPQHALRIRDYVPGMVLRGREMLGGRSVYVVDTARSSAYYSLYFDAETGLLLRIGHFTELHDYREVDGVKIPFRMVLSRKGGSTTIIKEMVTHNVPVADALFAMPQR